MVNAEVAAAAAAAAAAEAVAEEAAAEAPEEEAGMEAAGVAEAAAEVALAEVAGCAACSGTLSVRRHPGRALVGQHATGCAPTPADLSPTSPTASEREGRSRSTSLHQPAPATCLLSSAMQQHMLAVLVAMVAPTSGILVGALVAPTSGRRAVLLRMKEPNFYEQAWMQATGKPKEFKPSAKQQSQSDAEPKKEGIDLSGLLQVVSMGAGAPMLGDLKRTNFEKPEAEAGAALQFELEANNFDLDARGTFFDDGYVADDEVKVDFFQNLLSGGRLQREADRKSEEES